MVKKVNYMLHVYILTTVILFSFGHWVGAIIVMTFLLAGLT